MYIFISKTLIEYKPNLDNMFYIQRNPIFSYIFNNIAYAYSIYVFCQTKNHFHIPTFERDFVNSIL